MINASNWSPTDTITCENKTVLLQDLIYAEIIEKRQSQLQHLRDGLNHFNLIELCNTDPEKFQFLFVHEETPLTYETMINLIDFIEKVSENKAIACDWLKDYLRLRAVEQGGKL